MKRLFLLPLLAVALHAQFVIPPPASQTEVDAGTVRNKYVSPFTLANWSGGGGGGGAPTTATYLVQTANGGLSAERVATDTSIVAWDFTTPGQVKLVLTLSAFNGAAAFSSLTLGTPLAIAQGGTGATTASAAVDSIFGAASSGTGGAARIGSPTFTGTVGAAAITATGAVTGASFTATGSDAGRLNLPEGPATALIANTFSIYAPTDVAAGGLAYVIPAAAASGIMRAANSGGVMTVSHTELSGDATTSGSNVVTLANTAVTPASYTNTSLTVDSKGRITAASSGSAGGSNNAPLFTSTANAAADNTPTETSIIGTGVGSKTTSAAYFAAGTSLLIRISGYLSTPAIPDDLTIRIKAGSTSVGSAVFTLPLNLTNQVFVIEALVTCRTAGASGTFIMNDIVLSTNSTLTATISAAALNTATVTLDTTGTLAWDVTADWGAAQSGETITGTNALLYSPGNGAVIDPGANGFMDRTALNTTAARTLTGTTNQIAITNGGGGGNPVFSFTGVEKIATFSVSGGGSAIATGTFDGVSDIPFACTITGYAISCVGATGTNTFTFWYKTAGTDIPVIGDIISTSGVSLTTGTHITGGVGDFTTTALGALSMLRCAATDVDDTTTSATITLYGTRL